MAFAVTSIIAYGKEIDEGTTKRFEQTVKMKFNRTTTGDGTVNLSDDSLDSGDFWKDATEDATYGAIGIIAQKLWNDVTTRAESLLGMPMLTQQNSTNVYPDRS